MPKRLEHMKECLMSCIEEQMTHLHETDTKELGEAIDMVKDLSEAIYYCTITKAMKEEEGKEEYHHHGGYEEKYYTPMIRNRNMMDYNYPNEEHHMPMETERTEVRDRREGKSPIRRRYYMESKETHQDKDKKMKELERYLQELSSDITEMIADASPEETSLLQQKLMHLANKVK